MFVKRISFKTDDNNLQPVRGLWWVSRFSCETGSTCARTTTGRSSGCVVRRARSGWRARWVRRSGIPSIAAASSASLAGLVPLPSPLLPISSLHFLPLLPSIFIIPFLTCHFLSLSYTFPFHVRFYSRHCICMYLLRPDDLPCLISIS